MANLSTSSIQVPDSRLIKVLLVDDSETDCVVYSRYLQSNADHRYEIFRTELLSQGIDLWRSQSPDVTLLDVNLPDSDGLGFLEWLQTSLTMDEFQPKLPVIVLTGQGNEQVAVRAMKLGAMDYLIKSDITAHSLQKSVQTVIEYRTLSRQLVRSSQQKGVLSEIALQIQQSLDLSEILRLAVDGLRQLLGCDRAIIYQFEPDWSGWISVESVCQSDLSILGWKIVDPCFASNWHEPYCQGRTSHVNDRTDGTLQPCYAELLASIQVYANLVVPVLQDGHLWGLLVAHECRQPRHWEASDIHWVQQLATQVSIAIQQATAYRRLQAELKERQLAESRLQQLNQELEDRVVQRTFALQQSETQLRFQAEILEGIHDAVVATDLEGMITSWNHGAEKIFGYSASDMIGQNIALLYDRPADLEAVLTPLMLNDRHEAEIACRARSGELLYVHLRLSVSRNEQGQAVRLLGVSNDITVAKRSKVARQQAEAENRLLRERLQFILSSSPAVIYSCQASGNFATTFVSENIATHFGYTPDELLNQPDFWINRVHPDDRPQVLTEVPLVFERKQHCLEYRIQDQSGDYRWVQDELRLVCSEHGDPTELIGYLVDMTDRHNFQAQLQSLTDRLSLALESAEIGTWDWDLLHEAVWDDRMYALYGLENLGRPATYQDWLGRVHPDDRMATEQAFERSTVEGQLDHEFRIRLPNGSIRFIKAMGLMHYSSLGQPQRMVGINYDITERKQSETALVQYIAEIEDLYNNAPCGYHSLDWQGCFVRVNQTELRWLGYTFDEMIGRPFTDFLTEESKQAFSYHYPIFCQQGWVKDVEFDMVCKDGSTLAVLINATAVTDQAGNYSHSRSTLLDIRDRKQFEQQLQHTNIELARATRLKDEFLANMSHELRTPLNAILGLSEALQEQVLGSLNERQQHAIETIARSGQHLLELISDILDLSKISSGKVELSLAPTSVQNLCASSLLFVKQQAFKKSLHVTSDVTLPIDTIIVDERRIRQVLINLLTNAVKFTPEGGRVKLEVKWQTREQVDVNLESQVNGGDGLGQVQKQATDGWLLFSIIDTGIGIAREDLPRLFQPFVQIDSSLNRQQSGTGLGLAMVKQITEMHGGRVTVESQPGEGSRFTVMLPCPRPIAPPSAITADLETHPSPNATGLSVTISPLILLAEDNEANIATFTAYLSAHNYRVVVARNGEEAVSLAKAEPPDIILMDIQMPGMDGLEAMSLIRADDRFQTTPIIALTALAMPGDQERCLAAGANQYLSKPVGLKQLVRVIQQLI